MCVCVCVFVLCVYACAYVCERVNVRLVCVLCTLCECCEFDNSHKVSDESLVELRGLALCVDAMATKLGGNMFEDRSFSLEPGTIVCFGTVTHNGKTIGPKKTRRLYFIAEISHTTTVENVGWGSKRMHFSGRIVFPEGIAIGKGNIGQGAVKMSRPQHIAALMRAHEMILNGRDTKQGPIEVGQRDKRIPIEREYVCVKEREKE